MPVVESYASGLASDKPGLTEAEARLIEIGQISRGATMLILAECARSGFIVKEDGGWNLAPGARELAKFLSIERTSLQTLGLGRRAKPAITLSDYLNSKPPADPMTATDTKQNTPPTKEV